mgnify:CR=1 FL=1
MNVLKNQSVIKITRFFCLGFERCSGREVARRLSLNLKSTQKNLDYLVDANILLRSIQGRSYLYELNATSFVRENIAKIFVREKMSYKRGLDLVLESTIDFADEIILFGSYARGDYGIGSDLDLLFLTGRKTELKEAVDTLSEKLEDQFAVTLSAKIFQYDELDKIETDILHIIEAEGVWLFGEKKWQAKQK